MSETELELFKRLSKMKPEENPTVNKTKWHYIVEFIVDLRCPEDPDILDSKYLTLIGDTNSDCYFSECVDNVTPSDILPTEVSGHLNLQDTSEIDVSEPGIYRLTFGAKTSGEKYWTDCGYEYDAWEEYELLSQYKFTERENVILFLDLKENDPYDERFQEANDQ